MKHNEIVKKLIESKTVNFEAIGKFIAENGAAIALSDNPNYCVLISNNHIDHCIPPFQAQLKGLQEGIPVIVKNVQELQGR